MKKYKKHLIIIFLTFMGCQESKQTIKGDVYIKLIDFVNLYGSSKEDIKSFKDKVIQTKDDNIELSLEDKKLMKYYTFLITNDLLDSPHFKLKINSKKIITVFTNEKEYLKFNNYLKNLDRDKEKIIVEFNGVEKMEGFYFTDNIILVKKISGKTDWHK